MEEAQFEALRQREFSRLDATGQVYLDFTGAGLYAESQVRAHTEFLCRGVFGNPHSRNPTSLAATQLCEGARARVLEYFNADPELYEVVFTLNASAALKLVGEAFPWEPGGRFLLTADNHNSVNGLREFATAHGADVRYVPMGPELRLRNVEEHLAGADRTKHNLFAFPAQSNFSGVKHPLEIIETAHAHGYHVALDAAAFVPTNRLDLRECAPDFVCVSFYKMFGFPTGVGVLLARRNALGELHRPWFSGGTVRFVSAQNQVHMQHVTGRAFEDGTLNYLGIAAVPAGLDFMDEIGIGRINAHVMRLTATMLDELKALRHSTGAPMVRIYGPEGMEMRGGTVAFNLLDPQGELVDFRMVEQRANDAGISRADRVLLQPRRGGVRVRVRGRGRVPLHQDAHAGDVQHPGVQRLHERPRGGRHPRVGGDRLRAGGRRAAGGRAVHVPRRRLHRVRRAPSRARHGGLTFARSFEGLRRGSDYSGPPPESGGGLLACALRRVPSPPVAARREALSPAGLFARSSQRPATPPPTSGEGWSKTKLRRTGSLPFAREVLPLSARNERGGGRGEGRSAGATTPPKTTRSGSPQQKRAGLASRGRLSFRHPSTAPGLTHSRGGAPDRAAAGRGGWDRRSDPGDRGSLGRAPPPPWGTSATPPPSRSAPPPRSAATAG